MGEVVKVKCHEFYFLVFCKHFTFTKVVESVSRTSFGHEFTKIWEKLTTKCIHSLAIFCREWKFSHEQKASYFGKKIGKIMKSMVKFTMAICSRTYIILIPL